MLRGIVDYVEVDKGSPGYGRDKVDDLRLLQPEDDQEFRLRLKLPHMGETLGQYFISMGLTLTAVDTIDEKAGAVFGEWISSSECHIGASYYRGSDEVPGHLSIVVIDAKYQRIAHIDVTFRAALEGNA